MAHAEDFATMVLRDAPSPAWLDDAAPQSDVVLSTRTRVMRNLVGFRFPNRATDEELAEVRRRVVTAAEAPPLGLSAVRGMTTAERDHLVAARLASPDFPWAMPNRSILVDARRALSLMVNEEDHLRLQALSAGWSIEESDGMARSALLALQRDLAFAHHPSWGYLSASPFNSGTGRRRSAMFHLIGLAQDRRLEAVVRALGQEGLAVRGLFGEASRAIGAFMQVSATRGPKSAFVGACEYLIQEERTARQQVGQADMIERARQARDFAIGSNTLDLADALRVLGWTRWGSVASLSGFPASPRAADVALTALELGGAGRPDAGLRRAVLLRQILGG